MFSEVRDLLDSLDMESYLDHEGIDYKKTFGHSGPQLNVRECPSCGKAEWKVYLNEETGLGNCFSGSCHQSTFNKYSFIKEHFGGGTSADVARHIKAVCSTLGWRPKRTAAKVYIPTELLLPKNVPIPDKNGNSLLYLENRGVDPETAKYFDLRFCLNGGFHYEIGGVSKFQDYSGRIIIPIYDMDGVLASFQGRSISESGDKKYLFPPGHASTGSLVYNAYNSKGCLTAIMCEGVFDVISVHKAMNAEYDTRDIAALGSFGMHFTDGMDGDKQMGVLLELQKLGLKRIVIMWDGEVKAMIAAGKAAEKMQGAGFDVSIALLPKDRDPNELSVAQIQKAYRTAVPPYSAPFLERTL